MLGSTRNGTRSPPERLASASRFGLPAATLCRQYGSSRLVSSSRTRRQPGDASKLHFPSYGEDAAKYLVAERRVSAIGVDTASIDYGASKDFVVHVIANQADVFGLENVANLDEVPEWGAWIAALPMKIAGGSGGPVRIVAILP